MAATMIYRTAPEGAANVVEYSGTKFEYRIIDLEPGAQLPDGWTDAPRAPEPAAAPVVKRKRAADGNGD